MTQTFREVDRLSDCIVSLAPHFLVATVDSTAPVRVTHIEEVSEAPLARWPKPNAVKKMQIVTAAPQK